MNVHMTAGARLTCSKCSKPHQRKGQRYCANCHAAYQSRYRKKLKRERLIVASFIRRALNVSRVTEKSLRT